MSFGRLASLFGRPWGSSAPLPRQYREGPQIPLPPEPNLDPMGLNYGIELEFVLAFHERELEPELEADDGGNNHGIQKNVPLEIRQRPNWTPVDPARLPHHYYNSWGIVTHNNRSKNAAGELVNSRRYRLEPHHILEWWVRNKARRIPVIVKGPQDQKDKTVGSYNTWIISNDWSVCGQGRRIPRWLRRIARNPNRWDSFGIEVISRVLRSDDRDHKEEIRTIVEAVKGSGEELYESFITNQCALHVHVAAPNLETLKELAAILIIYEDEISRLHPRCRDPHHRTSKGNIESNRLRFFLGADFVQNPNNAVRRNTITSTDALKRLVSIADIRRTIDELPDERALAEFLNFPRMTKWRLVSMRNTANINRRDGLIPPRTVEFRQARGSLDMEDISHWIDFCVNLVKLAGYYVRHPEARVANWEPQINDYETYGTWYRPQSIYFLLFAMQVDHDTMRYWQRRIARYTSWTMDDEDERSDNEKVPPSFTRTVTPRRPDLPVTRPPVSIPHPPTPLPGTPGDTSTPGESSSDDDGIPPPPGGGAISKPPPKQQPVTTAAPVVIPPRPLVPPAKPAAEQPAKPPAPPVKPAPPRTQPGAATTSSPKPLNPFAEPLASKPPPRTQAPSTKPPVTATSFNPEMEQVNHPSSLFGLYPPPPDANASSTAIKPQAPTSSPKPAAKTVSAPLSENPFANPLDSAPIPGANLPPWLKDALSSSGLGSSSDSNALQGIPEPQASVVVSSSQPTAPVVYPTIPKPSIPNTSTLYPALQLDEKENAAAAGASIGFPIQGAPLPTSTGIPENTVDTKSEASWPDSESEKGFTTGPKHGPPDVIPEGQPQNKKQVIETQPGDIPYGGNPFYEDVGLLGTPESWTSGPEPSPTPDPEPMKIPPSIAAQAVGMIPDIPSNVATPGSDQSSVSEPQEPITPGNIAPISFSEPLPAPETIVPIAQPIPKPVPGLPSVLPSKPRPGTTTESLMAASLVASLTKSIHPFFNPSSTSDEEYAKKVYFEQNPVLDLPPPGDKTTDVQKTQEVALGHLRIPNLPDPSSIDNSYELVWEDQSNTWTIPGFNLNEWNVEDTSSIIDGRHGVCGARAVVRSLQNQYPNEWFSQITSRQFLNQYLDTCPLHWDGRDESQNFDFDYLNNALQRLTRGQLSLVWIPSGQPNYYKNYLARLTYYGRPGRYLFVRLKFTFPKKDEVTGKPDPRPHYLHWESMSKKE